MNNTHENTVTNSERVTVTDSERIAALEGRLARHERLLEGIVDLMPTFADHALFAEFAMTTREALRVLLLEKEIASKIRIMPNPPGSPATPGKVN